MASMETEKVIYKCLRCGLPFDVKQGSRRRYCPKCLVELVTAGKQNNKKA